MNLSGRTVLSTSIGKTKALILQFHEALAAFTLRATLRGLLKPVFSPRWPFPMQRKWLELLSSIGRLPPNIENHSVNIGGVASEIYQGNQLTDSPHGTLLYLHGGGYCVGSPRTYKSLTSWLASKSGMPVVVPDYRLAPEHPFPAALDDVISVYNELCANGPVLLVGDSAGGGLALSLALEMRDGGGSMPLGMVLMSPWVDLRPDHQPYSVPGEAMLSPQWMRLCAARYAGGRTSEVSISPLLGDLRELPPALIQCGSDDMLCDQSRSLHMELVKAGVDSTLEVELDRWHVYQIHAGQLPSADDAISRIALFLLKQLST